MQNLFRYVSAFVACAFIFVATTNVSAQADPGKVRELYNRMSANQKSMRSLISRVRMENYNPQTKETDKKDGVVKYLPAGAKSANIRIDWKAPQEEYLSVVDGSYKLFRPRLKQVYVGKTKEVQRQQSVGNSLSFVNMTGAQLKQNFDAKWLSDSEAVADGTFAYKMKLTPKTAASYNFAEIWVNEAGMPVQVKIYEKNGDTSTILLYEVQKNAKVSKGDLKIDNIIPKGTKEVKG